MGGLKILNSNGTFDEILYLSEGIITQFGITAKIISYIGDTNHHKALPTAAGNTKVYLKTDSKGVIWQMRVYVDHKVAIDFDWGHEHNKMPHGVVHVHKYTYKSKDDIRPDRSSPRYLNNDEIRQYGNFIKYIAPHAKLRKGRRQNE